MNFVVRKLIEWRTQKIMGKLAEKVKGYKTYIIAILGVIVALAGHFFGPIHIAEGLDIPQLDWSQVWGIVWNGGLFSALRMGVKKVEIKQG